MSDLLEWLKLAGGVAGIAALLWRVVDEFGSYLRLGVVVTSADGCVKATTTVDNKSNRPKPLHYSLLLVGPEDESPITVANELGRTLQPPKQIQFTNELDTISPRKLLRVGPRALIPIPFYYDENIDIADETLSYTIPIDTSGLTPGKPYAVGQWRLAKPSPAGFTVVIHGPGHSFGPLAQRASTHSPLLCHPRHDPTHLEVSDIAVAAGLHVGLVEIMKSCRDSSLWTVARSAWAGLQMNIAPIRCALFSVALEALFGPDDGREITYRLSQRLGFFLGRDRGDARELFTTVKRGYAFRSRTVHGNWRNNPEADDRMFEAEKFVRQSFVKVLSNAGLIGTFSGRARESFLENLVFKGGAA